MKTRNRLLCLVLVLTMILAMVPAAGAETEETAPTVYYIIPVTLDAPITRSEMADLTAKAMKLGAAKGANPFDDEAPESAVALYEAGIIKGSADNGKLLYRAASTITRAEMSAIIWRVYCAR